MEWIYVGALFEYWREYPPVHEILKVVFGAEPQKEKQYMTFEGMQNLMRHTGGKIAGM